MVSKERRVHWNDQVQLLNQLTKVSVVVLIQRNHDTFPVLASSEEKGDYQSGNVISNDSVIARKILTQEKATIFDCLEEEVPYRSMLWQPVKQHDGSSWGGLLLMNRTNLFSSKDVKNTAAVFAKTFEEQLQLDGLKKELEKVNNAQLEQTNSLIGHLLNTLNGVPWRMDLKTQTFTFIGNQAQTILGYSHKDWLSFNDWQNAVHPDDRQRVSDYCYNKSSQGLHHTREYRLIKKDGSEIWLLDIIHVIKGEDNQPTELAGILIDITDTKVKEAQIVELNKKLEFEQSLFHTFIDSVQAFVFVKDPNGRLLIANKYYNHFFDQPNTNFVGKQLADYIPVSIKDKMRGKELSAIKNKESKHFEFSLNDARGTNKWFYASYFPMVNAQGEVYALCGTTIDISKRKQVEDQVKKLNNQLEFILQATKTDLTIIDDVGNIIYNSNKLDTDGLPKCHQHFRNRADKCEECPRHKNQPEKSTYFYHPSDNEEQTIQVTAIPFEAEEGKLHMAEVRIDISEGIRIEKEIAELKNQLEFAMETGQIAYVEYDLNKHHYKASPVFQKLTGFDLEYLQPDVHWLLSRIHPQDYKKLKPLLSGNNDVQHNIIEAEFRFLNKQQEYIWLGFSGEISNPVKESDSKKISGIVQNITSHKQLLHELTLERNKSHQANQAKSAFMANMSHEIRTPMNAILGFSNILEKQIKEAHLQNYLKSIKASGKTLLWLINDLLDVAKIDAGKMTLKLEPISIDRTLKEIEQTFILEAEQKSIELKLIKSTSGPDSILIDELKIRQILLNLISNALKYTNKGSVTISYAFHYNNESNEYGSLILSIEDTGVGIAEEQQQFIFEPFVQEEKHINKQNQGTGLGLAITRRLVELMKGKISLSSKVGIGSTFTVLIPDIKVSDVKLQEIEKDYETVEFNNEQILIVDDVQSNLDVLQAITDQLHLKSILANNGLEAINLAEEHVPDVILLDIRMPVLNGFETIQMLKANNKLNKIPVIAISASTLESNAQAILDAGFNAFITKPVQEKKLIKALSQFLVPAVVEIKDKEKSIESSLKNLDPIDKEKLITAFNSNIEPIWEGLKVIQASDQMLKLSNELKALATRFNWKELGAFQEQLQLAIDAFDYESIQKQLKVFNQFIKQLKDFAQ